MYIYNLGKFLQEFTWLGESPKNCKNIGDKTEKLLTKVFCKFERYL